MTVFSNRIIVESRGGSGEEIVKLAFAGSLSPRLSLAAGYVSTCVGLTGPEPSWFVCTRVCTKNSWGREAQRIKPFMRGKALRSVGL